MNYSEKFKLKDKIAFVLGRSALIGREVSKALLDCGAKVVVLDRVNNSKKTDKKFYFEKIDIPNLSNIEKVFKKIIKKHMKNIKLNKIVKI